MWAFFFILIIALLLWPFIRILMHANRARRQFQDIFRQQNARQEGSRQRRDDGDYDTATGRRKVYGKDDGEYVDFEEVQEDNAPHTAPGTSTATQDSQVIEPQITDAEFEEVK